MASCDEEHSELVVGGVAVASGGASASFDDSVEGFGGVRCWCLFLGRESFLRSPLNCVGPVRKLLTVCLCGFCPGRLV